MKPSNFISGFSVMAALLLTSCMQASGPAPQAVPLPKGAPLMANPVSPPLKGSVPANVPVIKVGLLLPLSGESAGVGSSLLDAASLALYDNYLSLPSDQIRSQILLLPKDSGNTPQEAAAAAQGAIKQGATFIIGPVFSQSVNAVAPIAKAANVPMITFSNTREVASSNTFVFGFLPEQQVARMAEYAYLHNITRMAVLAPNDAYGEKVRDTLVGMYSRRGGTVGPIELHASSTNNIDAAVERLSQAYNATVEDKRFQAIYIADGGYQLKSILEALRKYNIDLKKVRLLGTGLWDDPEVAKLTDLNGAWFPSAMPQPYGSFERHFMATYNYSPPRLASLSYDAVTMIARLSINTPSTTISKAALTDPQGFNSPANGMVRLRADGTSDRKLAILEVQHGSFKVIEPPPMNFER